MTSCAAPRDRHELPTTDLVTRYASTWEYRYGESPGQEGALEWAEPGHDDGSWLATSTLASPPGHGKHVRLWLRTRLSGPPMHDPVLLIEDIIQSYEAYLDGHLIARFGEISGARARHFPGRRQHYVPLGEAYAGKMLTLRITSPLPLIGIWGPVRLGSHSALLVDVVRRGLPPLLIGAVLLILGVVGFTLYRIQPGDMSYLLYSLLALNMGVYMICRSPMRTFLFEEPAVWYHFELGSLCLTGATASAFVVRVLGGGPFQILRWLSYGFAALFVVSVVLVGSGALLLPMLLRPLQYLWLLGALALGLTAGIQAARGDTDARIFGVGMFVAAIIAIYELMQAMGVLPRVAIVVHYSAVACMLSLGIILARRVRAVHKRLGDFSTMLQLSLASAEELQPGQHAQIAIDELLRMLHGERGLLLLCALNSELDPLQLAAGRDSRGSVLRELPPPPDYDRSLVTSVLKKRRPLVREFRPTTVSSHGASTQRSVMAAPLLARGQLLGVLYLEADASQHIFGSEDLDILFGLGSQVAMALLASRAVLLPPPTE